MLPELARSALPILMLAFFFAVGAAQERSSWERLGALRLNFAHAAWTSPETLVSDLRSQNKVVRRNALEIFGIDANGDFLAEAGPNEIELRYAPLSGGSAQQAIVLFESASLAYAAVAVPLADSWERIAVFECWCKYENSLLDDFVRVDYTYHGIPDLVVRASGGGTGMYVQTEARFALFKGWQVEEGAVVYKPKTRLPGRDRWVSLRAPMVHTR